MEAWVNSCRVRNTDCHSGGHHYLHYLHHSLASGQTTGREHSTAHQEKNRFKIYWALSRTLEQDPISPTDILSHQEDFVSHLFLSIRGQIEWKPQSQKTNWSHGPQPCLTQWSYEPWLVGPPKTDGSWWRGLTKCGPLEKGMENHFSILALRTPWTVWKGQKIGHWKMNSPGQ